MKPNFKKLEDIDVEFVNKTMSEEETRAFSEFLKIRKAAAVERAKRFLAEEEKRKLKKLEP